jgi:hypothetical protein
LKLPTPQISADLTESTKTGKDLTQLLICSKNKTMHKKEGQKERIGENGQRSELMLMLKRRNTTTPHP